MTETQSSDVSLYKPLLTSPKFMISAFDSEVIDADIIFDSMSNSEVITLTPELIEAKDKAIETALEECDKLKIQLSTYHEHVLATHDVLYKLLTDIYAFSLRVRMSEYKQHIMTALISFLIDKNIKVQNNTSEMMIIVKSIIGPDRRRAAEYSRILEVATKENLEPKDLSNYIKRRGGIGQIYKTEEEIVSVQVNEKEKEKRLRIFRELFLIRHWGNKSSFKSSVKIINCSDEVDSERADFTVFITVFDKSTEEYRICSALNLGERQENALIKFVTKDIKNNNDELITSFNNYREKLSNFNLIPETLKSIWKNFKLLPDSRKPNLLA